MEFGEKLKSLRQSKGLTQEDLAEALYVSRTAVSKWESGRGYPNIESLKDISKFFSISVDDLLSGEKLLTIAEKENKSNIRKMCDLLFGLTDLFSFILVALPLYPDTLNGYIYSVNLLMYTETTQINKIIYWIMFASLFLAGIIKLILMKTNLLKANKVISDISISINVFMVIFLALAKEAYAVVVAFSFLIIKVISFFKYKSSDTSAF